MITRQSESFDRPTVMRRFFVVAQFGERAYEEEKAAGRRPVSLVHAKEMGMNRTACGLVCATWERFWDKPFPVAGCATCPRCLEVVVPTSEG
jgi:hypothetical protein